MTRCEGGTGYYTHQSARKMADGRPRYMASDQCLKTARKGSRYCASHAGAELVPVGIEGRDA